MFWKAPEDDGNSPIIEYIIEYQERSEKTWTKIKQISNTSTKITKLKTNSEYIFRAIAVNEVGESPPSPTSPYIKITAPLSKEAPVIQEPLTDIFIGYKQKVTLSCIVGGVPTPEITWKKNNETFESKTIVYENRVAKYTIDETTETSEATYTCVARNEVGTAETTCKVVVQDKPTIVIDETLLSQRLRTSAQWKIDAQVSGFPKPDITWYKNGTKITSSNKFSITYEENISIITINSLERSDTGKYVVEAKNNAGVASVELNLNVIGKQKYIYTISAPLNSKSTVKLFILTHLTSLRWKYLKFWRTYGVNWKLFCFQKYITKKKISFEKLDKPDKPETIAVKEFKKDSVIIEWKPPVDDGGLDITKYSIEKCDPEKNVWIKVAEVEKHIDSFCVQKLLANAQYVFRIMAENSIGASEPIESEPITIKVKIGKLMILCSLLSQSVQFLVYTFVSLKELNINRRIVSNKTRYGIEKT